MKKSKRILSLLTVLLLPAFLSVPAMAAGFEDDQLNFVTDAAEILTDEEWLALDDRAEEISEQYECGVYIIVVDDFTRCPGGDKNIRTAAKTMYQDYTLGYGEEQSGELLVLSMAERDYWLLAYGYGNTAFTDYGKDQLSKIFLDDFGRDDWYGGLSDYLEKSASMLKSARAGKSLDVDSNPLILFAGIGISLLLGCGLALLLCWFLKERLMKSVAVKTEADSYLAAGSVEITNRQDLFTHTTQTRTKIEKDSGGSGGTTVDSDGFSGKGGKF